MLRIVRRLVPLVFLSLFALSCADAAKHLRAQPAWFMDPKKAVEVTLGPLDEKGAPAVPIAHAGTPPGPISIATLGGVDLPPSIGPSAESIIAAPGGDTVKVKCVRTPRSSNGPTEASKAEQCLYQSIDEQDVLKVQIRSKAERNRMVYLLMNVSNTNCSTFLMRAFASKAGADATRNTGKDIATAIAAGTAKVASGLSSGVGLFNLVGGSAIDNFNTSYYAEKAFHVMAAAIDAERDKARTRIVKNSSADLADYSYYEALLDLHTYDDACSLRRGLESLAKAAGDQKNDNEVKLNKARDNAIAPARASNTVASVEPR